MSKANRSLLYFGIAVFISIFALLTVVGINQFDEPLDPDLAEILKNRPQVSSEAVQGFQYLISFYSAESVDPAELGKKYHDTFQEILQKDSSAPLPGGLKDGMNSIAIPEVIQKDARGTYINSEKFKLVQQELVAQDKLMKLFESRIDHFLNIGHVASDLPHRLDILVPPVLGLLYIFRLNFLFANAQLHAGLTAAAIERIHLQNLLIQNSLKYPQTFLWKLAMIGILRQSRTFVMEASKHHPEILAVLKEPILESFVLKGSVEDSFKNTSLAEITVSKHTGETLSFSSPWVFSDPNQFEANLIDRLRAHLFQKNRTINSHFQYLRTIENSNCLRDPSTCPEYSKEMMSQIGGLLVNPTGLAMINILVPQVKSNLEKLVRSHQELSQAFVLPN